MAIDLTTILIVSVVTCRTCGRSIPQQQAVELRAVVDLGWNADGIQQLRATGAVTYECSPCWDASFTAYFADVQEDV